MQIARTVAIGRQDFLKIRRMQGTWPVIFLSFANVKEMDYHSCIEKIRLITRALYRRYFFLAEEAVLSEEEKENYRLLCGDEESAEKLVVQRRAECLYRYYGKKAIILLDEYDTLMQETYVNGYRNEFTGFCRSLFYAAFKTNPYVGWC